MARPGKTKARDNSKRVLKKRAVKIVPIRERLRIEIEERKRAERKLRERLNFERLLFSISARFASLPSDSLDEEIKAAQKELCEFLGLEICNLWQHVPDSPETFVLTHLYAPMEVTAKVPQNMDAEENLPWSLEMVLKRKLIVLARITDAPARAARDIQTWRNFGIKSVLTYPLHAGETGVFGALNFCALQAEQSWPSEYVERLQIVAQMFANALNRRFVESNLRETTARLSLAADSVGLGFWSWDFQTDRFWFTEKIRSLYGFSPDQEVTGDVFYNLLYPDDREPVKQLAEQTFREGLVLNTEYRIVMPDKSIRWMMVRAQGLLNPSGGPDRMVGISLDITQHKQAELALAENEKRYRTLFESVPAGILLIGTDGHVRAANSLQAHMHGYESPQQLEGIYAPMFVAETDRSDAAQNMNDLLQGRGMPNKIFTAVRRNGSEFIVEMTSVILRGPHEEIQGLLCLTHDITKSKQDESERIQLRHEIAHISRVMTMSELSTSLAHEINQPLGAILNNASAAQLLLSRTEKGHDDISEILMDIIEDAKRAGNVVRRIRGMVKRGEAQFESLNMNVLIEEVIALLQNSLRMNKIALRLELAQGLKDVEGDRIRLQQVLMNLMMNALEAMKESPSKILKVCSAMRGQDAIAVSVSDSGKGINSTDKSRIFEPFFTTKKEGLGFGLPICRSIIEEHDGKIWAENNPDGGATFTFSLPTGREKPA